MLKREETWYNKPRASGGEKESEGIWVWGINFIPPRKRGWGTWALEA